jgi:type IV pilus assembly protein PilM
VSSGEIIDEGAVSEAVSALFKRAKVSKKQVIVGTANQRVIVRQVDVPQMSESELEESLPFQVQDAIPIPIDEALLDYVPVEEFVTPDGEPMLSILVVAGQREMLDGIVRIAGNAGITPVAIDLQPFALVRAVIGAETGIADPAPVAIVDIGGSITQIVLVKAGIPRFVRILPRGGNDFTETLAEGMGVDHDQAEEMKRRVGIDPQGFGGGASEEDMARRYLTLEADGFIEEVRGSVNYHLTQSGGEPISRLIVAGNGARLPHLANRLGVALGSQVEPARILEQIEVGRVQVSGGDLDAAQPVLPTSVGLARWGIL